MMNRGNRIEKLRSSPVTARDLLVGSLMACTAALAAAGPKATAPYNVSVFSKSPPVILQPVLNGNAKATDIATGGTVSLNLTDPDSMTIDPRGNIVLDSQADSELILIRRPMTDEQTVGRLGITSPVSGPGGATITLDDTTFASKPKAPLLVTDVGADTIYRIDSATFGFEPGVAYSASDTLGLVGTLNLDTGVVSPIVTGFSSARGLLFVSRDDEGDHDE
jgi:hypothetical protein